MKNIIFTALAFLLIQSSFAREPELGWRRKFRTGEFTYMQYNVSFYDKSYPRWNPAQSTCPLSPTNAISLAVSAAQESIPEVEEWKPHYISLEAYPSRVDWFWFYKVKLMAIHKDKSRRPRKDPFIELVVGIDEKVPDIKKMTKEDVDDFHKNMKLKNSQNWYELIKSGHKYPPEVLKTLSPEILDQLKKEGLIPDEDKKTANQNMEPTVKTPVESGKAQGTAGHP